MTTMTICDACGAHVSTLTHPKAREWATLTFKKSTGQTIHTQHLCPPCYQKAVTWLEKGKSRLPPSSPASEL